MSSKKRVEEEEEEEEEDSEPVVIMKGRKGSIKIVSDAPETQATGQTTVPKLQSSTSTSVQQQLQVSTDLSQPLHIIATTQGSAAGQGALGSPKGQVQASPKMPAAFTTSPQGQVVQAQSSPIAQAMAISPKAGNVVSAQASPVAPASPQSQVWQAAAASPASPKQTVTSPAVQNVNTVSPSGQPTVSPVQPPRGAEIRQPPAEQHQQPSPVMTQSQALSVSVASASEPPPVWSTQASPNAETGQHVVLKQVPLKPAAPLVPPEPIVLHPSPVYDGPLQRPRTQRLGDEAWRHADDGTGQARPERQASRLGNVWPPVGEEALGEKGAVPAVPVQAPESWVHQESVSSVHAIAAAPWARKQVGRIGADWPPQESEVERESLQFQRNLRPQWPPVSEEVAPSSQVYQKIAMSHVHTQVAKQQVYFNSGGSIKPDQEQTSPPEPQPQPAQVAPVQPVPPKPGQRGPSFGAKGQQPEQPVAQPVQQTQQGRIQGRQQPQERPQQKVEVPAPHPSQKNVKFAPGAQRNQQVAQQPVVPVQQQPAPQVQRFGSKQIVQQGQQTAVQQQQPQQLVSGEPVAYQNGFPKQQPKQPSFRPKFVR